MAWTASQIGTLRTLVNDESTSKQARAETPQNTRDSARLVFQVSHYPIVTTGWTAQDTDATKTSVYLTSGSTIRTQAGFTVDPVNGLLTFASAPTGNEDPWYVDYYWQWESDTGISTFLDIASYDVGFSPTATITSGLTNAWYAYAKHHFYKAMAGKYAWRFNSSGGGQGQEIDVVTQNFQQLSKQAKSEADDMKTAFYTRHGARSSPAVATGAMGIDPWTPIR